MMAFYGPWPDSTVGGIPLMSFHESAIPILRPARNDKTYPVWVKSDTKILMVVKIITQLKKIDILIVVSYTKHMPNSWIICYIYLRNVAYLIIYHSLF